MPSDEKQVQLPADLQEENRDVADLWKDALKAYKGIVGFDLEKKFDNVQAMIDQGTKEMNNFHSFRHNDKKVDKLRSLFANNLDYIQKGANQLIAAATPAFPPAAAIGTAITFMLGACRDQRADYDLVVVFFEDMNSFLQRVVILETRLPGHKAYQNCLMDVFTSFLTMCGYAHKYIELGRFKKWISNLLSGGDSDLSGARKTMDLKLTRLQNATEFAILGNTEDLKKMNSELQQNSDLHTAMLEDQKEVMSSIQENTETIRNDMAKLLKAFTDQKKETTKKPKTFNNNKSVSANRIRNLFVEIEGEDHEYYVLKDTIIPDTCNWLFDEPQWEEWQPSKDPSPVLAISGDPGVGKSHIGATIYDKLHKEVETDSDKTLCAAHFYFREQASDLHTFGNAINIIVIQVVEQNEQLCELVLAEFNKDETFIDYQDPEDVFRKLLVPIFRRDSKYHLKVMLDGVDELEDFENLIKFLGIIKDEELRISVVVTSRPERVKEISEANIPTMIIPVDKEKQKLDLRELIWNRLNSMSALRTFGRYVKQRVADKLEKHSPNMLYAENMLHRLNSLGREAAVLRTLEKPLPADLDELYEILVAECYKHLIPDHKSLVNRLLHWVAHKQSLTLDEVNSLLRLWTNDNKFDIDEIPDSILNLIRIGDPGADAEQRAKVKAQGFWGTAVEELDKKNADPDAMYNDGDLPVKFHERSMRAFFCDTTGKEESRRWKPSETKRQLFSDLASILRRKDEDITITPSLKAYIFEKMLHFWRDIDPQSHTAEEQAEVMETFASIMLNKNGFAELYCKQELGEVNAYTEMFNDESFEKVSTWASLVETEGVKSFLSDDVAQWWAVLKANPRDCLLELLKEHVRVLYREPESLAVIRCFNAIECLVELRPMDDTIAERAKAAFGDQATNEEVTPQQRLGMALENLFDDIPMSPNAHRAVGLILFYYSTADHASHSFEKALEMEDDLLGRLESQHAMAQILVKKEAYDEAYTYVTKYMENVDHDAVIPSDKRDAWTIKGSIEVLLGNKEEAAHSFAQARKSDPTGLTPGEALEEEIVLFANSSPERFIEVLKDWNPLERLTYLAHDFQEGGRLLHSRIRDAALKTHEEQFVLEVYEDAIKHLDNVKASAPIQVELALFHWQVRNDPQTASKVLDQVLESGSNLWLYAITNANPIDILGRAVTYQCDIAWKFFQESSDPEFKATLLESIRTILSRPLALDVPPNMSNAHRPLTMAKMYFKMGPVVESQKILQDAVNNCIDHLSDTVDWNDARNLVFLAKVLHVLSKKVQGKSEELTRVARILVSAQLSRLDPEIPQKDEDESEAGPDTPGEDDQDSKEPAQTPSQPDGKQPEDPVTDESLPDEGDSIPGERMCEGECNPSKGFHGFGNQIAYQCMDCFEGFLCEECYESRVSDGPKSLASKTLVNCDKGHQFLKMPIEGWHGVKDGKVMLEGEEPLEFKELLQQVRELCKGAWDEFWQG
ncbi:uncharacterized protein FIESC28_11179 [Fusarium coffeatum]|uniref:Uncharacterized protein n=1 Tax=Fusarium coffeatum TaxID=231269 RepID=A0A366QMK9_9HYPO|nr:uncharacterized protein FIESC28_11179 [Fusarium coffeatum]RBR06164.1 hypothetical protein FIESC28_11179 [Fusarium coffeatum]